MKDCLFCKIINGDIPSKKIFENPNVLAFVDIYPQAKIHLLFIHKTHSKNINEMSETPEKIGQVYQAIADYTKDAGMEELGFRVVTNTGKHAGQTVFHTHFHVVGGEALGHFGS